MWAFGRLQKERAGTEEAHSFTDFLCSNLFLLILLFIVSFLFIYLCFVLWNHNIVVYHICHPPSISPRSIPPLPYPHNIVLPLFLNQSSTVSCLYSLGCVNLPQEHGPPTRNHTVDKTTTRFATRCQQLRAPQQGLASHAHPPFYVGILSDLRLFRPSACYHNCCEFYAELTHCFWKMLFLCSNNTLKRFILIIFKTICIYVFSNGQVPVSAGAFRGQRFLSPGSCVLNYRQLCTACCGWR